MNTPQTPAFWVDCEECLELIAEVIERGGRVIYLEDGDFDLVG